MPVRSPRRRRVVVGLVAAAVVLAGCGTRLDHNAVVAASSGIGGGQRGAGTGVTGDGSGTDQPAGTDTGVAGTPGNQAGVPGGVGGIVGGGTGGVAGVGGGGGPIVIGTVGDYSGPSGAAWVAGLRALQAWVSTVNAKGGINGRKVQLLVYDDGSNGAKARSQVQELVEQDHAVAVVDAMATFTLGQWKDYVEQKKIPVIGGDCSNDAWNASPVLFTQCNSINTYTYSVVATGAKVFGRGKKFGALVCQETAGCAKAGDLWFNQGYAAQAGLNPVYLGKISLGQPDFTSECVQARNAGAEVMTVVADPNTVNRVAASCRRQNYNPQFVLPGAPATADTPQQPGLEGMAVAMQTFPFIGLNTPAAAEFQQAWQRYSGGVANSGAASQGWAGAKLFEKVVLAAGGDVSPAGIMKALGALNNERLGGLTVPLTYPPGQPSPDFPCWFVMQAVNGRWTAPQGDRVDCR